MEKSGITKLIKLAKTQRELGLKLGISQVSISKWVKNDFVPQKHIEKIIELYPQFSEEELSNPAIRRRNDYHAHNPKKLSVPRIKKITHGRT
jgi:hypothetical protein